MDMHSKLDLLVYYNICIMLTPARKQCSTMQQLEIPCKEPKCRMFEKEKKRFAM